MRHALQISVQRAIKLVKTMFNAENLAILVCAIFTDPPV